MQAEGLLVTTGYTPIAGQYEEYVDERGHTRRRKTDASDAQRGDSKMTATQAMLEGNNVVAVQSHYRRKKGSKADASAALQAVTPNVGTIADLERQLAALQAQYAVAKQQEADSAKAAAAAKAAERERAEKEREYWKYFAFTEIAGEAQTLRVYDLGHKKVVQGLKNGKVLWALHSDRLNDAQKSALLDAIA